MISYIKFEPMISQYAWKSARKYNVPFEEAKAEGNLIFAECLREFDDSLKIEFSTFLASNLRAVYRKSYQELRSTSQTTLDAPDENGNSKEIESKPLNTADQKLNSMMYFNKLNLLSAEAQKVLSWILSREWETIGKVGRKQPTKNMIKNKFGEVSYFYELQDWWKTCQISELI